MTSYKVVFKSFSVIKSVMLEYSKKYSVDGGLMALNFITSNISITGHTVHVDFIVLLITIR